MSTQTEIQKVANTTTLKLVLKEQQRLAKEEPNINAEWLFAACFNTLDKWFPERVKKDQWGNHYKESRIAQLSTAAALILREIDKELNENPKNQHE